MFSRFVRLLLLLFLMCSCAVFLFSTFAAAEGQSLKLLENKSKGFVLHYPEHWAEVSAQTKNAQQLRTPIDDGEGIATVMVIDYPNHQAALNELLEIASAWNVNVTFTTIDGWPAMVRRFERPLELVGVERNREKESDK